MLFRGSRALGARTVRRDPRGRGRPRRPRGALSLALLLAEHAPHRRGPRALLCRSGVSRAARRAAVAAPRTPDSRRRARPAGAARRVPLRAVDLLPPLHGRDLPALRAARGAERRAAAARDRRAARGHGRRAPGAPRARRLDAGDRRRRRGLAPAAGTAAARRPPRRVCRGGGGVPEAGLRVGRGGPGPRGAVALRPRALRRRVAGAAGPRVGGLACCLPRAATA